MTTEAPTYDLVLLLDSQAEDGAREKVVADTRAAVERQGELLRHDDWGERPLAYPIERKTSAVYHLLQFHAGDVQLLSDLERTLRITDEVVRFRLIKLKPGVPDAPDMRPSAAQPPRRADSPALDSTPLDSTPLDSTPQDSPPQDSSPEEPPQESPPQESPPQESSPQEPPAQAADEQPASQPA